MRLIGSQDRRFRPEVAPQESRRGICSSEGIQARPREASTGERPHCRLYGGNVAGFLGEFPEAPVPNRGTPAPAQPVPCLRGSVPAMPAVPGPQRTSQQRPAPSGGGALCSLPGASGLPLPRRGPLCPAEWPRGTLCESFPVDGSEKSCHSLEQDVTFL